MIAGLAWLAVIALARGMSAMSGTMGLGLVAFIPVWTLMMAAMMLPSVAPVAVLYGRSVTDNRILRLAQFAAGYIVVWGLAGLPAFAVAAALSSAAMDHPETARYMAAGIFLVLGLYQVSPLKDLCLSHCRSPFSLLMHYANFHGPLRDLRAGTHHALYCLGWDHEPARDGRPGGGDPHRKVLVARPCIFACGRRLGSGPGRSGDLGSGPLAGPQLTLIRP